MPNKVRIRRFSVLKTASVFALMYVVLVAVIAIPILLILLPVSMSVSGVRGGEIGGAELLGGGVLVTVLLMVFYGIFAWIFGAIFCLVYNLVARLIGGIEVDVERFGDTWQGQAAGYGYAPAAPGGAQMPPGWTPGSTYGYAPPGTQQPAWPVQPGSSPGFDRPLETPTETSDPAPAPQPRTPDEPRER